MTTVDRAISETDFDIGSICWHKFFVNIRTIFTNTVLRDIDTTPATYLNNRKINI